MAFLRGKEEIPTGISQILLPGERLVAAVHSHWARVAEPVLTTVFALGVLLFIDANLTKATEAAGTLLWWVWFFLLARMLWRLFEWRHDWFVATDKRLLLRYGLITHKVAMMPLIKVTDMSYVRSIPGQFLGYGRFVMESAGQDQALRTVEWVPNPDETYREICAVIFNIAPPPPKDEAKAAGPDGEGPEAGPQGGGPGGGPGAPAGTGGGAGTGAFEDGGDGSDGAIGHSRDPYPDVQPVHNPIQDRLDAWSRAIPVRRRRGGESLYESEDIQRRRRSADTGPIPLRPRHEPRVD